MTGVEPPDATLFGWPKGPAEAGSRGHLCVVGAATDHGNPILRGAELGPTALRQASLSLPGPAIAGIDSGDLCGDMAMDLSDFLQRLAGEVERIRSAGLCPLVLGGDHSISYAPVSVLQRSRDLCLVWFDAHTDFSPWLGTAAHNHKQVLRRISQLPGVQRILQIGYRGITTGDERQLGDKAAVVTTEQARHIRREELLALLPRDLPCYISIDIDIVDPESAPATGAPVPDGLEPTQVQKMLEWIVCDREVIGIDLVEVNPTLEGSAMTSSTAAELIHRLAGNWRDQLRLSGVVKQDH